MTINGLRTVKDHVKLYELFQATREAHKVYGKRLSNEKEELLRKKAIQDGEKERLKDGEKGRQQEALKLKQKETVGGLFQTCVCQEGNEGQPLNVKDLLL